jgi:FixJ family two-component response regulator
MSMRAQHLMTDRSKTITYTVDEDNDFRDSTEMLLMAAGIAVLTFSSGRTFFGLQPSKGGCIVLDITPDMLDPAVLIPVGASGNLIILFTPLIDQSNAENAKQLGVAAILRKPVDHVALVALVTSLLEGSRLLF